MADGWWTFARSRPSTWASKRERERERFQGSNILSGEKGKGKTREMIWERDSLHSWLCVLMVVTSERVLLKSIGHWPLDDLIHYHHYYYRYSSLIIIIIRRHTNGNFANLSTHSYPLPTTGQLFNCAQQRDSPHQLDVHYHYNCYYYFQASTNNDYVHHWWWWWYWWHPAPDRDERRKNGGGGSGKEEIQTTRPSRLVAFFSCCWRSNGSGGTRCTCQCLQHRKSLQLAPARWRQSLALLLPQFQSVCVCVCVLSFFDWGLAPTCLHRLQCWWWWHWGHWEEVLTSLAEATTTTIFNRYFCHLPHRWSIRSVVTRRGTAALDVLAWPVFERKEGRQRGLPNGGGRCRSAVPVPESVSVCP